jgi:hypothetical protein
MLVEKTCRVSRLVSLLTLLVILQTATPAFAWGRLGHRVVSRVADRHLTPTAGASPCFERTWTASAGRPMMFSSVPFGTVDEGSARAS